jgi:molybdate transport system substrate-binding protein
MRAIALAATGVLASLLLFARPGHAADLKLIVATPMTGVVNDLGGEFQRSTGHRLTTIFVSGPVVKTRIDEGTPFDVAVSITPVIDALVKEGKLSSGTRADVAYAVVGLGVRAGALKPDISTVAGFRRALLNANSVAHSATGASGDHFKSVLERLGITEQMAPKLRPMPAETIAQAVPSGQAEMIVVTASVILVPGVDFVGPIPAELQFYNTFAAAVGSRAGEKAAGQALIARLTSPQAVPILSTHGMQPGLPK